MTRTHYELGLSGREACCSCGELADVYTAAACLPPGEYWILEVEHRDRWDPNVGWTDSPLHHDYGTLQVRDRGDWCLRSRWGCQAGPG